MVREISMLYRNMITALFNHFLMEFGNLVPCGTEAETAVYSSSVVLCIDSIMAQESSLAQGSTMEQLAEWCHFLRVEGSSKNKVAK